MKALSVPSLPAGKWLYEIKFDGYRALAFKSDKETRLVSRNQKEFTKLPELNDALKRLPAERFIIDGEIAALDPKGRSSFQLLQAYEIGEQRPPLVYYAFDLLFLDGSDLRKERLAERIRLTSPTVCCNVESRRSTAANSQTAYSRKSLSRRNGAGHE
jgi:bifunctional non-homologous end joining protein LigD